MVYYKLTDLRLTQLVRLGLISQAQADEIMLASHNKIYNVAGVQDAKADLNKAGTIQVRSINYYAGCRKQFVAEIVYFTSNSAFSRFINKHNLRTCLSLPFTY